MKTASTLERKLLTHLTEGKSRALIIGGGGIHGAFFAGFVSTLGRNLGHDFFDAIYAVSVGVYEATFFASGQPKTIERTWREHVDGLKLINPFNILRGRPILKLEYLTEIFQNEVSRLDTQAVLQNTTPTYALTDLETGEAVYKKPRNREEIFRYMEASSALPIRSPIEIDGRRYVDGNLSIGEFPVEKALEDGHEEILVLSSKLYGFHNDLSLRTISRTAKLANSFVRGKSNRIRLLSQYRNNLLESRKLAIRNPERIEIVEPDRQILFGFLDTNKRRINRTVDLGQKCAEDWLRDHGY